MRLLALLPIVLSLLFPSLTLAQGAQPGPRLGFQKPHGALWNGIPTGPTIPDDSATQCHAWWNGFSIQDRLCAWTMNGTVPQVLRRSRTMPAAGPFTDTQMYSLGTGSDALDFSSDFSVCVIFNPTTITNGPILVSDGRFNAAGWAMWLTNLSGGVLKAAVNNYPTPQTTNAIVVGGVNVACMGMSGTTLYAKMNRGSVKSVTVSARAQATTTPAYIGRDGATSSAFNGLIYEVWASATPGSDALFTSIQGAVKSRYGVTAW